MKDQPGPLNDLSEHSRRPSAAGAFDWPVPRSGLHAHESLYRQAPAWPAAMPFMFPRFHHIYHEAKVHESWGRIDDQGGRTIEGTLDRALRSKSPMVQIATWNDWGEGTIIEPSLEFAYRDREVIQRLRRQHVEPGFSPSADDLRLPLRLYELRKAAGARAEVDRELVDIANRLAERSTRSAREALDPLEARGPAR